MVKKFACLFLILASVFCICEQAFAQGFIRTVDSLWSEYHGGIQERPQIDLLNEISYAYRRVAPDSIMKYANVALDRALKLKYHQGMAIGYKNKGIAHYKIGSPSDTIIYYYNQAIVYAVLSEDYYTQAACYNNIALINLIEFSYNQAIQNLLKGVEVFDKYIKVENRLKALMLCNLGGAYTERGETEKGIDYYEQGIAMADRRGEESIRSIFVDELARAKMAAGRIEEAKLDVEAVIPLQDKLADYESKVDALLTLGDIYSRQNIAEKATQYGQEALALASEKGFKQMRINTLIQLSRIYQRQQLLDQAIEYGQTAVKESRESGYLKLEVESLYLLSDLFAQKEEYTAAYNYLQEYEFAKEKQRSENSDHLTAELEAKYHIKDRQSQIDALRRQQRSQRDRIQLLFLAVLLFLFLLIVALYFYVQKARTTAVLNEKNSALADAEKELNERNQELKRYIASNLELENFAHLASHDLREPMRTIVSFSQLLERSTKGKLNNTESEYLLFVQQGIKRIERLVNDLLAFSIVNNTKPVMEKVKVKDILNLVVSDLQQLVLERRAVVEIQDMPGKIQADKSRIYRVFQNLLANAIKYSKTNVTPKICFGGDASKTHYHFYVVDNGIGIDATQHQKIFLLFKTLQSKSVINSSGIGLAICKKIVEQHGGKIWLESSPGKGSVFHFTIARERGND